MITQEYLIEHRKLKRELLDEIKRLNYINLDKASIASPQVTGMPRGSSTGDPTANDAIKASDQEAYVYSLKAKVDSCEHVIESYVRRLSDEKYKQVIRLRYLSALDWDDVLIQMYGDKHNFDLKQESYKRRMYGVHRKAVDEILTLIEESL